MVHRILKNAIKNTNSPLFASVVEPVLRRMKYFHILAQNESTTELRKRGQRVPILVIFVQ